MNSSSDRLHSLRFVWDRIIKPPYSGIGVVVCLYVLTVCLIYQFNGPFTGHIVGFDDKVRMVQVLNLINGGGWYDRTIMRANPPEGFETIWARIVDLPIAAIILLAQIFVEQKTAALAAAVIVPFAELILLFFAARYAARPLVGKYESWLVVLFVAMTSVLNRPGLTFSGFLVGEASHRSWYIILNVLMTGAVARIALGVRGRAPDIWLSIAIGLFLAVGIEGFPLIAGAVAVLAGIAWGFNAPQLARRSAKAVAEGAFLGFLLLLAQRPPEKLLDVLFTQPSILGPIIISAAALFLVAEVYILRHLGKRKTLSLISLVLCAVLIASSLVYCFPQMLDGAASGLSPRERALVMGAHSEAWTMFNATKTTGQFIGLAAPSIIAVVAGLVACRSATSRRQRIKYLAYLGLTAVSGCMAQIYWRYIHHAMVAACPWLLWLWQNIRQRLPRNNAFAPMSCLIFVALGPFWMLVVPILDADAPSAAQIFAFPAKAYFQPARCDVLEFARYLDEHYPSETLLNVLDSDSASFLYYTNLRIDFLANYPSHDKFLDNIAFFKSQDANSSSEIAARHKFDLVALCRLFPMSPDMIASRPYRNPMMLERLIEGQPPAWLKPVNTGLQTNFLLFEVDKKALAEAGK